MAVDVRTEISRQVNSVRRRLFARELLRQFVLATAVALGVTTAWLLVEPYAGNVASWTRWAVFGGTMGMGLLVGFIVALRRRPDTNRSALWLDEAFNLRERVTSSLSLDATTAASSAGQALFADTLSRVKGLKVREQFPVRVGPIAWSVPSAGIALALVALFYDPTIAPVQAVSDAKPIAAADKAELEKKLAAINRPKDPLAQADRPKSEDLKKLEAKLEEIAKQPRDNTKQLREQMKALTPLEDEVKKLEREERSEKSRMMQQSLQSKDALAPNDSPKDGPANDFQKALAEGDLDKARDELSKLAKKMEKGELTEKDKENLAKQLDKLQKKLGDMAQQKKKEEQLKDLAKEGKLDPEALEREMQQLKKDNEKLKDLQKLADKMNQCQNCMKAGDMQGAQQAMSEAAKNLDEMARDSQEINDLREQLESLREAKDALAKAGEEGDMPGGNPADGEGGNQGNGNGQGNGGRGQGAGNRPEDPQGKIRQFDAKQHGQFNAKGQKVFDGFVPGQGFNKKSSVELNGEIKQAAQEAPETIETQRIPKAARDMAKGYFKNLGGQAEGEKVPEKKGEEKKADEKK